MARSILNILRTPVLHETRANLARSWARLPEAYRSPRQMYGRQGNGCGATIGAMPRCDFACRGCYLGGEANRIPALPVDAIKAQMLALRETLGNAGNLQLTDGEVTLRPEAELIELLRYAQSIGLIPMLMTHGDSFRRRPGLLERLMVDGGLVEVSIHVDTTQRGRQGSQWRNPSSEAELNPLRDEFAAMIRTAQLRTGRELRAATTMTVTRENLCGVSDVMRWIGHNAEAFRMISFQPIAQVGRTEGGFGGGVAVEELWREIERGLVSGVEEPTAMERGHKWLGHPACNRFVHGVVVNELGRPSRFYPAREHGHPVDERVVDTFLSRFGGITFRADSRSERVARLCAVAVHAPGFAARNALPYARHWLRRLGEGSAVRGLTGLLTGRLRTNSLVIVSHHFMSAEEIGTSLGGERISLCVFKVPVNGELLSMCEVNALGVRDRFYADIRDDVRADAAITT